MLAFLNKPHYVFRPTQALRRLALAARRDGTEEELAEAVLPWGLPIAFRPRDEIGFAIRKLGLFDLCVSETIWRLLDPGEVAIDAGANIGHMTSVMAARAGARGTVLAFEPHPELFAELEVNAARWSARPDVAAVLLHEVALSDRNGRSILRTGAEFGSNRGTASLEARSGGVATEVTAARLDDIVVTGRVGLLKLDVEGHELQLLAGATRLIAERRVRDIVFEEWEALPSEVSRLLEAGSYSIFSLDQGLLGLRVGPAVERSARRAHQAPSYLATLAPERALARLRRKGWAVLRVGRP